MNSETGGGNLNARCAVHPDNPAGGTCTRCGNFLCFLDTEGGRFTTCESCRLRTSLGTFPLNRSNYAFGTLWDYCWNLFKVHWLMLSLGILIPGFAYVVMAIGMQIVMVPFTMALDRGSASLAMVPVILLGTIAIVTVLLVLQVGVYRMFHDALEGQAPDIGRIFSQFSKTGRLLVMFLILFAGAVAVMIPFALIAGALVWATRSEQGPSGLAGAVIGLSYVGGYGALFVLFLPFYNAVSEIALSEKGAVDVLRDCWRMASEFRVQIFLVMLVGIPLVLVGMLACCIGIIPAMALLTLLHAGMHRAIRTGVVSEA